VVVRPLGRGVAVSPPLTIESEQLEMIGEALAQALDSPIPEATTGPVRTERLGS